MKKLLTISTLLLVSMLYTSVSRAQFQGDVYRPYHKAKVYNKDMKEKGLAWCGGVNNPQFAMADFNQDGREDLVIFENYVGVRTFIATGKGQYEYDGHYEGNFPEGIVGYLALVDYNMDGVKDLIHRGAPGYTVYKGYYSGGELRFQYFKGLYYHNATGPINAYVEPTDIPGIADIDHDGDIDFVSYDVFGTTIQFYRNCAIEDGLPLDSIRICLLDNCWSKTQQYYERQQLIGYSCTQWGTTCKGGSANKTTHSGNTLCLFDVDGDTDYDYFNGNVSFPDIQFFKNGKVEYNHPVDSAIHEDTIWSANGVPMFMPIFPAAFHLDIDHDGKTDLLFSPHAPETENYKSISFYKNMGSDQNPNFTYQADTYLVDKMIDMGKASYPVFYDYDKDGKPDLFIGSDGFYQYPSGENRSKIAYYKNITSAPGAYAFQLVDDNFLDLYSMNISGAALAMGDLNNDSLDDLVIGRTDGRFMFFKNIADSNTVQPNWVLDKEVIVDKSVSDTLDVGDYAAPAIYDINKDGRNDLIAGNQLGDLYYFNNYSSLKNYLGLRRTTENLGGIDVADSNVVYGYSTPYFGPMDNTGDDYLVIGTQWGQLYRYDGFQSGSMPQKYTLIDSVYSYIDVRERAAPAFANIDNDKDNLYEMVSGNILGGLLFYKQDFKVGINDKVAADADITVYPNPAKDQLYIKWGDNFADGNINVQLVSVTGQRVAIAIFEPGKSMGQLNISELPSGMYYCIIQSGASKSVQPVSILR